MPKTWLGKLSLVLIVLMPLLIVSGSVLTGTLYKGVAAGNSIGADLATRPALALSMLAGICSGILAFAAGLMAILRQKERSPFVIGATIVGGLLLVFLAGEFISPH